MDEGCKEEGGGMVEERGRKERWMRDVRKRGKEWWKREGGKERWMRDVRKRKGKSEGGKERWMRDVRKRGKEWWKRGREGKVDEGCKEEEGKGGREREGRKGG